MNQSNNPFQIFSDNVFFHKSINAIISEKHLLHFKSCGKIAVIDAGCFTGLNDLIIAMPVCHIIFVLSRREHMALLSSFEWGVPVSYVSEKCSPDYLGAFMYIKLRELQRRKFCKAFYNNAVYHALTEKELTITTFILQGKSLDYIAKQLSISHHSAANYRTKVICKSFKKLDIKGVRTFYMATLLNGVLKGNIKKYKPLPCATP